MRDDLQESDLFGVHTFRSGRVGRLDGYYASLAAARPLVRSAEWTAATTGFYLNVAGDFDAVRISYFAPSAEPPRRALDEFGTRHALESLEPHRLPSPERVAAQYGGEELRFRRYLATYTQIGLDITEADLLHARRLFAVFRWCVSRARWPYRPFFEPAFHRLSPTFQGLRETDRDRFFADLENWPVEGQVDWAHMFVNMVLGCDWLVPEILNSYYGPQQPASFDDVNRIVASQGFEVPAGWMP